MHCKHGVNVVLRVWKYLSKSVRGKFGNYSNTLCTPYNTYIMNRCVVTRFMYLAVVVAMRNLDTVRDKQTANNFIYIVAFTSCSTGSLHICTLVQLLFSVDELQEDDETSCDEAKWRSPGRRRRSVRSAAFDQASGGETATTAKETIGPQLEGASTLAAAVGSRKDRFVRHHRVKSGGLVGPQLAGRVVECRGSAGALGTLRYRSHRTRFWSPLRWRPWTGYRGLWNGVREPSGSEAVKASRDGELR